MGFYRLHYPERCLFGHRVTPLLRCHLSTGALRREELSSKGAEITALERRRAKTWAITQGMMQQPLVGRVRLVCVFVPRSVTGGVTPQSSVTRVIPRVTLALHPGYVNLSVNCVLPDQNVP
jgi:hypothetical protein